MKSRTSNRQSTDTSNTLTRRGRRTLALAKAEGTLLRRNMFALSTGVAAPVLLVLVQLQNSASSKSHATDAALGTLVVTSSIAFAMVFSLYCTLVTSLVARRESLTLKRLRSGELQDAEVVAGTAVPALAIATTQVVAAAALAAVLLELRVPTNGLLLLVAIVLGSITFIALAALTTTLTRTVELSQLTSIPLLLASLMASGLMFPVSELPATVGHIADVLPLTSVVDLLKLGMTGQTRGGATVSFVESFEASGRPLVILSVWVILSVFGARTWFRWEPRR